MFDFLTLNIESRKILSSSIVSQFIEYRRKNEGHHNLHCKYHAFPDKNFSGCDACVILFPYSNCRSPGESFQGNKRWLALRTREEYMKLVERF